MDRHLIILSITFTAAMDRSNKPSIVLQEGLFLCASMQPEPNLPAAGRGEVPCNGAATAVLQRAISNQQSAISNSQSAIRNPQSAIR